MNKTEQLKYTRTMQLVALLQFLPPTILQFAARINSESLQGIAENEGLRNIQLRQEKAFRNTKNALYHIFRVRLMQSP